MIYMRRKNPEPPAAPGVWPRAWLWMIANALAGPSVGVACFQWGVATMKPGILMPIVATVPVVTQFIAWVVDGQRPTARTIIGGIIAVAGVAALFLLREGNAMDSWRE
jgi:drug/metabolite transporter (DMT)-like permease